MRVLRGGALAVDALLSRKGFEIDLGKVSVFIVLFVAHFAAPLVMLLVLLELLQVVLVLHVLH